MRYLLICFFLFLASVANAGYRTQIPGDSGCYTLAQACTTHCASTNTGSSTYCVSSVPQGANQCVETWTSYTYTRTLQACDESCPSGQERYNGQCVAVCPAGEIRNSSGTCGPCTPTAQGFPRTPNSSGVCVANCTQMQGQTFGTVFDTSTVNGCKVSCTATVGSAWPLNCVYTGEGAGDGTDLSTSLPQDGIPPPPGAVPDPTPNDPNCPANTSPGYVNGEPYCAPTYGPGGVVIPPGTEQNATTSTTVQQQTSTTVTNSNGSTTTTIITNTTSYGSSASTGEGEGTGEGAGDCDPTATNYFECIGVLQAPPEDGGASLIQSITDQVNTSSDADKDAVIETIDDASTHQFVTPDGVQADFLGALPGSASCNPLVINIPGHVLTLSCARFEQFKQVYGYFLYLLTFLYIWRLAVKPIGD